jgi:hypothetical protein
MCVDVDQKIVLERLGLDSRMGENVARIRLDGDLGELSHHLFGSLQHRIASLVL